MTRHATRHDTAKGSIKYSQKGRASPAESEYELTLNEHSVVHKLDDDPSIPRQTYAFVSVQSLPRIPPSTPADVIGVIVAVGSVESKTARAGVVPRLKVSLADESGHCVGVAIWGDKARRLHAELVRGAGRGQVMAVKGAKVYHWSEGDGVSLTAWETCAVDLNPDTAQTTTLTQWWNERGGSTAPLHSVGPPVSHPSPESEERQGTLADMRESEAKGEAGLWRVEATLLMIKADSPLQYPACPLDRCGKRVEWLNMQWYCNKCQTLYEVPEYRYIASVMLGDHTGGQWATSFNEVGATLFGVDAKQVAAWQSAYTEESRGEVEKMIRAALFRRFVFKVRVAPARGKASILAATPVDPAADAVHLIAAIQRLLECRRR